MFYQGVRRNLYLHRQHRLHLLEQGAPSTFCCPGCGEDPAFSPNLPAEAVVAATFLEREWKMVLQL